MNIRFRAEAANDVASARAWYEDQRQGLGGEFVQALGRVVSPISELPEAFPEIATGYRRALFERFPYALYYRVAADTIEVIACLHTRRSPGRWSGRL